MGREVEWNELELVYLLEKWSKLVVMTTTEEWDLSVY